MSTAQRMQPAQSELTVASPQAQPVEKLKKLMAERGMGVKTVVATKDGKATDDVAPSSPSAAHLTGREEVEPVRSVVLEMREPSCGRSFGCSRARQGCALA
jgi:hypothetical protein